MSLINSVECPVCHERALPPFQPDSIATAVACQNCGAVVLKDGSIEPMVPWGFEIVSALPGGEPELYLHCGAVVDHAGSLDRPPQEPGKAIEDDREHPAPSPSIPSIGSESAAVHSKP